MPGTCDHCHEYNDSIHYTSDYGEICNNCVLKITRPYIKQALREVEARINGTEIEDNSFSVETQIEPHLVDKLEDFIMKHKKRLKEIENDPSPILDTSTGIVYANSKEYRKCQQS